MKKIIFSLALMLSIFSISRVYAQDPVVTETHYYYYPSDNVYYNETTGDYWYYDTPTSGWISVKTLPANIVIKDNAPRFDVVYSGTDVWKDNKMHLKKYKVKKDGRVKAKHQ